MAPKKKTPQPAAPSAPARQAAAPARTPAAPARTPAAPSSRPAPASRPQAQGPAWNANLSANSPKAVAVNNAAADLINRAATAGSEAEANRLISQAQALAAGGSGSPGLLDLISRQARGIESRFTAAGPTTPTTTETASNDDGYMRDYYAGMERQRQQNAIAVVQSLLNQYGLSSLYNTIVGYIQEGYDADTVMVLIRTTPEYKKRFPAMEALAQKGRAISEAEYINYETLASGLERRYGLPESMLMGKVTDLLVNEVSMTELNDRVVLASAAAIQAPQDVKNIFSQYYGIGQGGMTAYWFDPDIATPLLEKQYASALIGTEAARQGIGIDVYGAQNLQSLGITTEEARQGFGQVAAQRELTTGLGETLSQQQLIGANLAGDQQAQQALQRVQGSRTGAFQGGGGFAQGQGSVALGSASR